MKNRIRNFRHQQKMTLKELADRIGTTPQTVSRLETEVMTLSADWLERLGQALGVHATELLDMPDRPDVPVLGMLNATGILIRAVEGERLILDIRAERPVAVRMAHAYGPYRAGEVLVGTRLDGPDLTEGLGRDCICCLPDGRLALRRLAKSAENRFALISLNADGDIRYNVTLLWAARLVLRLEYL